MDSTLKELLTDAQLGQNGAVGNLLAYLAGRDGEPEATAAIADADLTATKLSKIPAPTGIARALDSSFTVSSTSSALVIYTVELAVTLNNASVRLLIGTDSPPTDLAGEAYIETTLLSGLVSLGATSRQQLVGFVRPGYNVLLSKSGSGTASLVQSLELVF